jgi:hypothetical protein
MPTPHKNGPITLKCGGREPRDHSCGTQPNAPIVIARPTSARRSDIAKLGVIVSIADTI